MQNVKSSNVKSVGYDAVHSELHVLYVDTAGLYVYLGVPPETFERLLKANSIGGFLNREVKAKYKFEKR